ncbi:MAG: sugar transferase [Bdellovibrionales bacterium]|nr:sugar transferase [Bdellovibrionales bacterium]
MLKRTFDFFCSFFGLILLSPLLLVAIIAIWLQDYKSPFYLAPRIGKNFKPFTMVKLRSMVKNADKTGVSSTSADDVRITKVGHMIRKLKLDELSQLWNVLIGDMSLVGPRPNIKSDVETYSEYEKKLLSVRPGITDFSSIVFSDEGEILRGSEDPDADYVKLIRPWKSKLGVLYIENKNLLLDIKLIILTIQLALSRSEALLSVSNIIKKLGAEEKLVEVCKREKSLTFFVEQRLS